jgi:hypothetical protein
MIVHKQWPIFGAALLQMTIQLPGRTKCRDRVGTQIARRTEKHRPIRANRPGRNRVKEALAAMGGPLACGYGQKNRGRE